MEEEEEQKDSGLGPASLHSALQGEGHGVMVQNMPLT